MSPTTIITGLTTPQADGLTYVTRGTTYLLVTTPHVPVGRSLTGSQVFAYLGCSPDDVQRATEGVPQ